MFFRYKSLRSAPTEFVPQVLGGCRGILLARGQASPSVPEVSWGCSHGIPGVSPAWPHRKLLLAWELPTPGCSGLCRFCRVRTDRACESC